MRILNGTADSSEKEARRLIQRIVAIRENAEGDGWRLNAQALVDLDAIEDFLELDLRRHGMRVELNTAPLTSPAPCDHPKDRRRMLGWNEVCGVCGQGRDIG